jgi:O-antigen ligase
MPQGAGAPVGSPSASDPSLAAVSRPAGAPAGTRSVSLGTLPAAILLALGLAVYYFAPALPLAAAGAIAFLAVAVRRLDVALLTVLATAPLFRVPRSLPIGSYSLAEFCVLACAAAWLLRLGLARWRPEQFAGLAPRPLSVRGGFALPALLFLGAGLLSLVATSYPNLSLRVLRTTILEPVIFYALIVTTLDGHAHVRRYLDAFVLLGLVVALFSFFHYAFIGVTEEADGVRRLLAVYHSPNHLALFFGRVLPVAFALALFTPRIRPSAGDAGAPGASLRFAAGALSFSQSLFYGVTLLLVAAALVLTFSRGAWLATLASLASLLALRGRRPLTLAAFGLLALLLLAVPFLPWERLASPAATQGRLYVWEAAVAMVRDRPLQGIGLDNFLYLYPNFQLPHLIQPDMSHPHNWVLDHWLSLGLLGLLVALGLQVRFWQAASRLYRRAAATARPLIAALMGTMLAFLVHGLIDNSYFLIDLAFYFWMTVALLEVTSRETAWTSS